MSDEPAPVTKRIRVNPGQIQENYRHMESGNAHLVKPAIVVELPHTTLTAFSVEILGPSRIVQKDSAPIQSGARVWIETDAELEINLEP